jgi:hypothetical protein
MGERVGAVQNQAAALKVDAAIAKGKKLVEAQIVRSHEIAL